MAQPPFRDESTAVVARLTGAGRFQTALSMRGGTVLADEPVDVGGLASGPTPYELLSAALGACTAMTMKLYADHKGWEMPPFHVEVTHAGPCEGADRRDRFSRVIVFEAALDEERRERMLHIANRCPVHRTLERGFTIETRLSGHPAGEPPAQHLADMERACEED